MDQSASGCFQTTLKLSKVASDTARGFSGALESVYSCGGAFQMLQNLTHSIVKFWSNLDLCIGLGCWDLLCRSEGALETCISTAVFLRVPQAILSIILVLNLKLVSQSQADLLYHNAGCIFYLNLSIYIHTVDLEADSAQGLAKEPLQRVVERR